MDSKYFIAFDLGATSGRTILGTLTGDKLTLEEVTRFPNQMLQLNGHFYWNIFSLYENLKKGLTAVAQKKVPVTSIGIVKYIATKRETSNTTKGKTKAHITAFIPRDVAPLIMTWFPT